MRRKLDPSFSLVCPHPVCCSKRNEPMPASRKNRHGILMAFLILVALLIVGCVNWTHGEELPLQGMEVKGYADECILEVGTVLCATLTKPDEEALYLYYAIFIFSKEDYAEVVRVIRHDRKTGAKTVTWSKLQPGGTERHYPQKK